MMMIAVSAIRKFLVRQREEAETTHTFLVVATKILRLNLKKNENNTIVRDGHVRKQPCFLGLELGTPHGRNVF